MDSREAALAEAGHFIVPSKEGRFSEDRIYPEMGEPITGATQGRPSRSEITLFKSVGLALQGEAAQGKLHQLAKEKGIGTRLACRDPAVSVGLLTPLILIVRLRATACLVIVW